MKSFTIPASLMLAASLMAGCARNSAPAPASAAAASPGPVGLPSGSQTPEQAIHAAIQAHLAHKGTLNLRAFQTAVKQVTIQNDRAQAEVEYRVKDGPGSMQLTYALRKTNDVWSVVETVPVGSNFSHPALDQAQAPASPAPGTPVNPMSDPTAFFNSATANKPAPARQAPAP